MLTDNTQKYLLGFKGYMIKSNTCFLCYRTVPDSWKMFTGARKKHTQKKREIDWQLVADIFCSVPAS